MTTGAQIAASGVATSGEYGSRVADQIGRLRRSRPEIFGHVLLLSASGETGLSDQPPKVAPERAAEQ